MLQWFLSPHKDQVSINRFIVKIKYIEALIKRVLYRIDKSEKSGKKWVIANDEQNPPKF